MLLVLSACSSEDSGGMSGTGVSQGSIDSFGSIFVNGVEWDLDRARVEFDGVPVDEADLRLGMVVRVRGDLDDGGLTGRARSVDYDEVLEGPIENAPVLVLPGGTEKTFDVLGRRVSVDAGSTAFGGGASFAGLAQDDVLEISGFVDDGGVLRATRVELEGFFPAVDEVELRGTVSNLMKNPDGSGLFDLGTIMVRYAASTDFEDVSRNELAVGDFVEVDGTLSLAGDEIGAMKIELEEEGLGISDADEAEIEGFVSDFVSVSDFRVAGTAVDASGATFEPPGLVLADGMRVEVEGALVGGVLVADEVESEDDDDEDVDIEAAIFSIDPVARSLVVLGVEVETDAKTELEDERDGLSNFGFDDLRVGDWVEIDGGQIALGTARAKRIRRDFAEADVRLEGPVTSLDRLTPALSVLDQPSPIDMDTLYFDALGQPRSEMEFFDSLGGVQLGDVVRVTDVDAAQDDALLEADEVEISDD
jgi:hypothetical protein